MNDKQSMDARHLAVLNSLDGAAGSLGGVEPILQGAHKDVVADNPTKCYVLNGAGERTGVLILSNDVDPGFVADPVKRAALAKEALGEKLGSVILDPLRAGVHSGLSFAVWSLCGELSSRRVLRFFQKRALARRTLKWMRAMTAHTMAMVEPGALDSAYVVPLRRIQDEARLGPDIRDAAAQGIERLRSGLWQPRVALEHGDLWLGNFLLPAKAAGTSSEHGFVVIDWKGSNVAGYPVYDLLRHSRSFRLSARLLRRELLAHSDILSCDPSDLRFYLLASLGDIGLNLEHFPVERYLAMCELLDAYLKKNI